ncbi:hypothetical protein SAMN05421874_101357 [Nonomuraea maritima]|uniref:Uncharacterized protein n=1 Tax=Nonomuraea maritima TaxID=683260 RepID=A0A1G8SKL6_9ACTN|nr:hypothetical protein SAMN05421874_101357 [Nonomuraea maritima]
MRAAGPATAEDHRDYPRDLCQSLCKRLQRHIVHKDASDHTLDISRANPPKAVPKHGGADQEDDVVITDVGPELMTPWPG